MTPTPAPPSDEALPTSEPWTIDDAGEIWGGPRSSVGVGRLYDADDFPGESAGLYPAVEAECAANVRRLRAMLAACHGLPTEALESGVITDLLAACRAALEEQQDWLTACYGEVPEGARALANQLRAAISKAEGGQP